jgi:DNA-binding winged helix-turn-helix (wHTH) protein
MSSLRNVYRFDEFELSRFRRTLLRNGQTVPLLPKTFEVLSCLVENPERVLAKEEILRAVWPESFVEENNLTQHISLLRKALADRAGYIVTVPGRGYQFTARVVADQQPARDVAMAPGDAAAAGAGHSPAVDSQNGRAQPPEAVLAPQSPQPVSTPRYRTCLSGRAFPGGRSCLSRPRCSSSLRWPAFPPGGDGGARPSRAASWWRIL